VRIANRDIITQLKKELLSLPGYRKALSGPKVHTGLGEIEAAFPANTFPIGAVHELISMAQEDAAATNGFIAALLSKIVPIGGAILWISNRRTVFPTALASYGLVPERILFIDLSRTKETLWAIEEALKCNAVAAVVGELNELSFTESRRLQLAVEESNVTGFIHRYRPRTENIVAFLTRWKIKPAASIAIDGMPGVGFPRWNVQLVKVRNGQPGKWQVEWRAGSFKLIPAAPNFILSELPALKAG
jgi:protein ImuA